MDQFLYLYGSLVEGAISSVALFCCSQSKNISKSQKKRVKKQKRLQEELDKMEANRSEG